MPAHINTAANSITFSVSDIHFLIHIDMLLQRPAHKKTFTSMKEYLGFMHMQEERK